jgi:hypothetical protein
MTVPIGTLELDRWFHWDHRTSDPLPGPRRGGAGSLWSSHPLRGVRRASEFTLAAAGGPSILPAGNDQKRTRRGSAYHAGTQVLPTRAAGRLPQD